MILSQYFTKKRISIKSVNQDAQSLPHFYMWMRISIDERVCYLKLSIKSVNLNAQS